MEHEPDDPLRAALAGPLARLQAELADVQTPPGVEKELMQAFAARHGRQPWYRRWSPLRWALTGGAGSLAALSAVLVLALRMTPTPSPTPQPAAVPGSGAPFIALDSLERIEQEPGARTVQADLTGADLAAMGVPVNPDSAGDTVRAELLVSSEGQPLALRFL